LCYDLVEQASSLAFFVKGEEFVSTDKGIAKSQSNRSAKMPHLPRKSFWYNSCYAGYSSKKEQEATEKTEKAILS
jgi:hypothetical protein